ncbi:MAG: hypothetical protein M9897_04340 [Brumimicrobium sp.]|nr:hypothetical protein [Brumimicrobium sp.]
MTLKIHILIATILFFGSVQAQDSIVQNTFSLKDFYASNQNLDELVEQYFSKLSPSQRVAQLIMPAIGKYGDEESKINTWVKGQKIGGILLLNGTKDQFTRWVKKYNGWNVAQRSLPFLYSADAEPSLVNRKIINSTPVKKANTLLSAEEVIAVANTISKDLKEIGINYNFAPVVDMSPNKTVGWRGFGQHPDSIIPWSNNFITATQNNNIIATAKHFPGHGLVEGDTHKQLVYIKGEMKEVSSYPPIIANEVVSIMIAHIAIEDNEKYNTNGLPSSISKVIVTDLLRDSLKFKGLIITDAMNMLGVANVPQANIKAIEAGVDILLMPLDAGKAHQEILDKYNSDAAFQEKVNQACKRIIRAKLCTEGSAFPVD